MSNSILTKKLLSVNNKYKYQCPTNHNKNSTNNKLKVIKKPLNKHKNTHYTTTQNNGLHRYPHK